MTARERRLMSDYEQVKKDFAGHKNIIVTPVGNIDLYIADYGSAKDEVEIDLFDENDNVVKDEEKEESNDNSNTPTDNNKNTTDNAPSILPVKQENKNDFEITAEELVGINFIPTAQRMQTASQVHTQAKGKVNIKTIFVKGLLWALIGAIVAFGISELTDTFFVKEMQLQLVILY